MFLGLQCLHGSDKCKSATSRPTGAPYFASSMCSTGYYGYSKCASKFADGKTCYKSSDVK